MEKPIPLQHQTHVLFEFSPLDGRDEIDDKTQRTYQNLKQMMANKTTKECHELYMKFIATNIQQNTEELTMGILVAILVDQDGPNKYYRDIVSISKDGLGLFCNCLNIIIIDRLNKLRDHSIRNIFWIINQLMKAGISHAETVCLNLIRQIAGGDLSAKNLWLIESVLDLLIENRPWLINSTTFMIPSVVYTFMRLVLDHMGPNHNALRQKEVDFVIGLIREKFWDSMQIGRDFLRLLHNVVKIPEYEKLWHDIYNNPKSLHPTFHSPIQILSTRTPRRLILSRLTFEMERKISFLATQVKFGSQKRYQDWFHKQYLATPESLSLRCDLIRYICTIIHPSNEVLCSEIIPRWAIIGWLLTTCTSTTAASNSKLALFFDWLLYDAKMDNIMNIEPAILCMYHSIRSHPLVTAGLLDYLCKLPMLFAPKLSDHVRSGIKKSLQQILEKRVVPTLAPLFDNTKHDSALRALIRESFPEFCANVDNGISLPNPVYPIPNATTVTTTSTTSSSSNSSTSITSTVGGALSSQQQAQTNQLNAPTNHNNGAKVIDVISLDNEKVTNSLATIPDTPVIVATINATGTVGNRSLPTQENTNHITNKAGDQVINLLDDKPDQSSSALSTPSLTLSPTPTSPSSRDETKAFSWNGTENVTATYSHKQQQINHDNKNRKLSTNTSTGSVDSPKKNKGPSTISASAEGPNNVSKYLGTGGLHCLPGGTISLTEQFKDNATPSKVLYPFMTVPSLDFKETISSFDEAIRSILKDLSTERCNETRCSLMAKLISVLFDNSEQTNHQCILKELGHCLAHLMVDDFSTRIFPSTSSPSQDKSKLDQSISSPFFVLCRSAFSNNRQTWATRPMSLLNHVSKFIEGSGFLILYYLRVKTLVDLGMTNVANHYLEFCVSAKRKLSKCLYDDLFMCQTYDSEMFCFLLPSVFSEIAACGNYSVTGNIDLIRLVVSAIDPINLQELICLCLTGTCKVINKEDVLTLIETSLNWESWEQYCLWKLISAQSVPVENYISVLPKLQSKANAEAMSCILLNLQKIGEPTANMIQHIISCECKPEDPYLSSILRYWSMKTDTKQLAVMICSLSESRPSSPQVKRKGQTKTSAATTNKNSSTLSSRNEKILGHLESIRRRAPKNKLLAQTEILEMIAQLETLCNESQRKRFADLFSNRPRPTKKQKKLDGKELTA